MPKGKASGAKKARSAGKVYQMAERVPEGQVLRDLRKGEWKIGKPIGSGGFGLIYMGDANTDRAVGMDAKYVIKVEPYENGPLYIEMNFYQRCCQHADIREWVSSRKLKFLGIPRYIATGNYENGRQMCRFMVIERFGPDLQKLFEKGGKKFPLKTVCSVAIKLLDSLEYIHSKGYAHADIKASNLLLGYGKGRENEVYLADFGLVHLFRSREAPFLHRKYIEDPRKKHDGTIEFTSRDAHNGVGASRRGDLEIMGYCLLQWLCGQLPWEDNLKNQELVAEQKRKYMRDIPKLLSTCFHGDIYPDVIQKYLHYVVKLQYDEEPNYNMLRALFRKELQAKKLKDDGILVFADNVSPLKQAAKTRLPAEATGAIKKREEARTSKDQENTVPPKRRMAAKTKTPAGAGIRALPARTPSQRIPKPSDSESPAFQATKKIHSAESTMARKRYEESGTSEDEENATPSRRYKLAKTAPAIKRSAVHPRAASSDAGKPSWKESPAFSNSVQPTPKKRLPQKRPSPKQSADAHASNIKRSRVQKVKTDAGTQTSPGLKGLGRHRKKRTR